ncbi:uncharacterized protein LOC131850801 [Achroia grisella]|uniref:uncharacterized protein LOC131850801 n=1 Tax=Achroia grisella TaxID=688607 RepID=UPI0027D2F883|nr:uncharacterized protein LOC131850801 [Achroia grisella]
MSEYAERSQRPRVSTVARIMLYPLLLTCVLTTVVAAPASYDQRQDGDFNVRADVQNVLFLVVLPEKVPTGLLGYLKNSKPNHDHQLQERADIHVMEAFVEPNTPYHVDIGTPSDRSAEGDGRAVEVVIAGRRNNVSSEGQEDELKLLGATEQCGPDRERDPVTLTCREIQQSKSELEPIQSDSKVNEPAIQPEVVPVS